MPMIFYAPGMKARGESCEQIVEFIDLYPTLVSLCGLPKRMGLDGVDLSPVLNDPTQPTKEAAYTVVSRTNDPAGDHAKTMSTIWAARFAPTDGVIPNGMAVSAASSSTITTMIRTNGRTWPMTRSMLTRCANFTKRCSRKAASQLGMRAEQ